MLANSSAKPGSIAQTGLDLLAPLLSLKHYVDGEIVHQRGDRQAGLSIVIQGGIKMGNYGLDGRYFLSTYIEPGESYGEFTVFSQLPRTHTAEAVGDTTVGFIGPIKLKRAIAEHPQLALDLITSLSTRLHWCLENLDDSKRLPLPVRLAKIIAALCLTQKQSGNTHIALGHKQLAEQAGLSRVSISKGLKALEDERLIRRHYQKIEVIHLGNLHQWIESHTQTLSLTEK